MAKAFSREERIREMKECGQSIIDNAERIYGDYKYPQGMKIIIELDANKLPSIQVIKNFHPEGLIDKILG